MYPAHRYTYMYPLHHASEHASCMQRCTLLTVARIRNEGSNETREDKASHQYVECTSCACTAWAARKCSHAARQVRYS